jgi:hypothetical protein
MKRKLMRAGHTPQDMPEVLLKQIINESGESSGRRLCLLGWRAGGAMDGFSDALVRSAAANVAAHEIVDVSVGGFWFFCEQRDSRHNLSGLAVAALRNVFFDPSDLNGVATVGGQPFNRHNFLSTYAGDWRNAGARGLAVDVHGAGSAQGHSAPKFCPCHIQGVAQNPQKRHIWADVHRLGFAV